MVLGLVAQRVVEELVEELIEEHEELVVSNFHLLMQVPV